jgi:hypothetical protein
MGEGRWTEKPGKGGEIEQREEAGVKEGRRNPQATDVCTTRTRLRRHK